MAITTATGFRKYDAADSGFIDDATNAIFKEFYLPSVRDLINSQRILSTMITRNTEDISGRYALGVVNTTRNEGVGFIGEAGLLPDPGAQGYEQFRYRMKYDYGRILLSSPSISSSRNDRGAFIRVLDAEIRGLARDIQHENNRVMFGNGLGALAIINTNETTTTNVPCVNPGGFANVGPGTQYLRPGMRFAIIGGAAADTFQDLDSGGGGVTGGTIATVDQANSTFTYTLASGTSTLSFNGTTDPGYIVRISDTANVTQLSSSFRNEPYGLAALIGEGNAAGIPAGLADDLEFVGGINATTTPVWNSALVDNGGTPVPFTMDMLQRAEDNLAQISGYQVDAWITSYGIRRQYLQQLQAAKRYPNTMTLDGGWNVLEYNGRPLVVDKDATRGRIYGFSKENLMLFTETDYQWMDADGSILHRLPNQDAYQATLYRYWSMGTDARNRHVLITDIVD